ncbi:type I 3-dehydroquinate dehydratase [Actinomyces qiguomingii]|uniref:type I 3-dehydroquinate dehydratase n=1 Tax=Actinomyces qiguomingii TaxID=2057800 RepID=UPI000CA01477|nr:type I 3-dehydroquinate dehydratase [Actinomyces qiguomingii]
MIRDGARGGVPAVSAGAASQRAAESGQAVRPAVDAVVDGIDPVVQHVEEIRDRLRARGLAAPGSPACSRPATWGGATLGGERPAIAVATTGTDATACAAQAAAARRAGADLVELRADLLTSPEGVSGSVSEQGETPLHAPRELVRAWLVAARAVGEVLRGSGMPVLFTVRTAKEGGGFDFDDVAYRAALMDVVAMLARERAARDSKTEAGCGTQTMNRRGRADTTADEAAQTQNGGAVAAIDVELARGELPALVQLARRAGIDVVASSHDFAAAPDDQELMRRLHAMQDAGAAVAKIAVTPADTTEAERVLGAAARARGELDIPVVVIAMGWAGAVSRLAGGVFGSALTFATAGSAASAPGQLPIARVRAARSALHP